MLVFDAVSRSRHPIAPLPLPKGRCPMNPFVYEIPTKVYFGENQLEHLGSELARTGLVP